MASVRTYTIIYVVLLVLGTGKFVFFSFDQYFTYWMAMGGTLILAIIKSALIMGYYQHLFHEPRSISYLMGIAVFMVFLLTIAAGYSIQ
ncbi:cytochrome C oxidase subunit IV family protein [Halobacteria archaeon AArc-m2/3/4]|uniref:Cytochrome C oxidase subunit IV family protein n=1 Tax=Natronoglomus mannanivorans TaxID=2979990 RepID=A0AAP2YYQ3_9EURY|nr:cytochrome C oxidase subunit IV family protein [Halobacteria archaeon AArc-xg1-1]MCU4973230.1 cytochrome C oxidase subunit IV family protein [Halobacteria archaeon AArc-m2/3/4]